MANKKDIFQLFRDNKHKLQEAPSPRAWHRLEQRLDANRQQRRPLARTLRLAAAVLAMVALASLISLLADGRENRFLAANGKATPAVLEDLRHTDADPYELQTVKVAQQAQQQLRRPISEGTPSQKLIPANQSPAANSALHWLEGQWISSREGKTWIETWRRTGPTTLEGSSTPEGQYQPAEQMRISQEGRQLYFSTDFGAKSVRYTLLALSADEAIFENLAADFPQQAIFRLEGREGITVIYQNRPSEQQGTPTRQAVRQLRPMRLQ